MTETIKIGDRVLIRGITGEVVAIEWGMASEEINVTLAEIIDKGDFCGYNEIEITGVSPDEITPLKFHETTDKQQYTGEWEDNTMSNIKVTQARIDHLMNTAKFEVTTVFGKCTVVAAQFENGFILVESSGCVDPANYDKALGTKICKEAIKEKLWQLEGYALQKGIHKLTQDM